MPTMRAVQVSRAGGPLELVEREIPQPGPRQVRVKVEACGLCHSDTITGLAFNIHACPGTRSPASSTPPARMCRRGSPGNAWGSGGSAGIAGIASRAVVEASSAVCGSR